MSLVKGYFNFYFKDKKSKKKSLHALISSPASGEGRSDRPYASNSSDKKHPHLKAIMPCAYPLLAQPSDAKLCVDREKKLRAKHKITNIKRRGPRGLSAKKIFVAKGDLKHTSSKAVITLYLYNTEKKFLIRNIKKQIFDLYRPNKHLIRRINRDRYQKEIITYNRPFSIKEYLRIPDHYTDYITSFKKSFIEKLCRYSNLTNKHINLISNLVEIEVLNEDEKL